MNDLAINALLIGGGGVIAYAWLANRLMHATQGLRERAATQALELIYDDQVSPEMSRTLAGMIDTLYARHPAWILAVLMLPATIWALFTGRCPGRSAASSPVEKRVEETITMGIVAQLGLSPISAILCGLQFLLLMMLGVSGWIGVRSLLNMLRGHDNRDQAHRHA